MKIYVGFIEKRYFRVPAYLKWYMLKLFLTNSMAVSPFFLEGPALAHEVLLRCEMAVSRRSKYILGSFRC